VVIDTSALVAILLGEPEAPRLTAAIRAAPAREVGAPTYVEAVYVMGGRHGAAGVGALDALLAQLDIAVVPMTAAAAAHARDAYKLFGKGGGTVARVLNLGDCQSYGVALDRGGALLYKGDDFRATPIAAAPY
jgi:ribonuclease VapC